MSVARLVFYVIHGPNLDRLGTREPEIYGAITLAQLNRELEQEAEVLGIRLEIRQSAHEGELISWLHDADKNAAGVAINPGGYTHTSVALHDAIRCLHIPVVEVHLSNLFAREDYRRQSITGAACRGIIMGLGEDSYKLALRYLADLAKPAT